MADLNIQMIGEWKIRLNNVQLPPLRAQRTRSLLSYLLLQHDQAFSKALLAEQFWPDSTIKQARANLRRELYSLRRWHPIATDLLQDQDGFLQWAMPSKYRIDIESYRSLFDQTHSTGWSEAVAKELAEFEPHGILKGINDEWARRQQEQLTESYVVCIRNVLRARLLEDKPFPISSSLFEKLIEFDSFNEENYALVIRSHIAAGNKEHALRVWHHCHSVLREELDASPGPLLQRLYHEELGHFDSEHRTPTDTVNFRSGLIGRDGQWSELTGIVFQRHPKLILISGEPGIGKTHLAEEFIHYCRTRGDATVKARATAGGSATPLAPVSAWFRCSEIRESVRLIDERKQSLINAVIPEIGVVSHDVDTTIPERFRRERLFSALSQSIERVEKPLVMFMDDIHWCDEDTLSWLNHLFSRSAPDRLLVVATIRTNRAPSAALNALMQSVGRQKRLILVGLEGLDPEHARSLGNHTLKEENVVASAETLKILESAAGNPFYIIEMARAIAGHHNRSENEKAGSSVYTGEELYDVIRRRLEVLSDEATDALRVLSALHRPFTDAEFRHFCAIDSRSAALTLTTLIESDVITAEGDYMYRLVHDCIAEALYSELSIPLCRHYHEKIARASQWADAQVTLPSSELAYHLHHAGRISDAVDWYLCASQEATNRLSSVTAIQYVHTALDLLQSLGSQVAFDQRLVELLMQKLVCQQIIDGFFSEEIIKTCEMLEKTLHEITDSKLRLYVLNRLRSVYGNTDMSRAVEIDKECMALVKKHPNPVMQITARRSMGFMQFLMGNFTDASKTLSGAHNIYKKAIKRSTQERDKEHSNIPIMLAISAMVDWIHGKPQATYSALSSLTLFRYELVPPRLQFFARSFLWQLCFLRGDPEGLGKHYDWYLQSSEAEPNRLIEDHVIWVGGMVAWSNDDYGKAATYLERSLQKTDQHTLMLQPQRRVQLAEVLLLNGDRKQAGCSLTLALKSAQKTQQKYWESERFRVGALLLEAESAKPQEVLSCYSKAIKIAKRQRAVCFEIRALRERIKYLTRIGESAKAGAERRRIVEAFGHLKDYPEVNDIHRMNHLEA